MRFQLRTLTPALIAIAILAATAVPTRADAHGLGGLEPSETTAKITSIKPASKDFTIESLENGERIRLTQKSARDLIVKGVDNEPYIRIAVDGTYLNQKSATRLINGSKSDHHMSDELKEEYAKTSGNPLTVPEWKKISTSRNYTWHDHRTHYMGSVPNGVTNLGSNELVVRVGQVDHAITVAFRSVSTPYSGTLFILLGLVFCSIALMAIFARAKFITFMNRYVTCSLLAIIGVSELTHILGYMSFAQQSVSSEIASSLYGIIFILLVLSCLYKFLTPASRRKSWAQNLQSHAPLLCVTGFIGIAAGTLIEYRTLTEPYPATALSPLLTRTLIVCVGCLSAAIFALGLIHIKQKRESTDLEHNAENVQV